MEKIKVFFKKPIFIILTLVLLFFGYYFFNENKKFYKYIDNSTVAIISSIVIGLLIWYWQHKSELRDKYFAEYINSVYEFFAIKKEEISLRKGKNRRYWDFVNGDKFDKSKMLDDAEYNRIETRFLSLDNEQVRNQGRIESNIFLLKELGDYRYKKIEDIRKKFADKFKKFSKEMVIHNNPKEATKHDVYSKVIDCIEDRLDDALKEIGNFINK